MSVEMAAELVKLNQDIVRLFQAARFEQARTEGEAACEMAARHLGRRTGLYADTLNNVATANHMLGEYATAIDQYTEVLEITREVRGADDAGVAETLTNMGAAYRAIGDFPAAEKCYVDASTFWKRFSHERLHLAVTLSNLGLVYEDIGDYPKARSIFGRAVEIHRSAGNADSTAFATALNNLGHAHHMLRSYDDASSCYESALAMRRRMLPPDHPDIAQSLNNRGGLAWETGDYETAERMYAEARATAARAFGTNHPEYATTLDNMALLQHSMGRYDEAALNYEKALGIRRAILGPDHPDVGSNANNLAKVLVAMNRLPEAVERNLESISVDDRTLGLVFSMASERQRAMFLREIQRRFESFLSLVVEHLAEDPALVGHGLSLVIRRKGIGVEALAVQRDAVRSHGDASIESMIAELTLLRRKIAAKTLAGPGSEPRAAFERRIEEWQSERERLEAMLARRIPEMELEQRLTSIGYADIARALPPDGALIEFVRFRRFRFRAVPARAENRWGPAQYAAFVLLARAPERPQLVNLGDAAELDSLVSAYRAAITGELDATSPGNAATSSPGTRLRALVLDRVLEHAQGVRRLFLAPDGALNLLPFEVLPLGGDRRVIDEYRISYLGTARDVLRMAMPAGSSGLPVVIGDPAYDLGQGRLRTFLDRVFRRSRAAPGEPAASGRRTYLGHPFAPFAPLPKTRSEAQEISATLGVPPLLREEASKGAVEAVRSPAILHIATHGWFLPAQREDAQAIEGDGGALRRAAGPAGSADETNPLLRSGLALAGVNDWLSGRDVPLPVGDGLLNAEDVTGIDLCDTELAVLSACDAGLGEIQAGEGVFGLRRAFVIAGVRTLIMSLWKLPERETREMMTKFYRRLRQGENSAEALREVQLEVRRRDPHPFRWGAFVCQGNPGPVAWIARGALRQ